MRNTREQLAFLMRIPSWPARRRRPARMTDHSIYEQQGLNALSRAEFIELQQLNARTARGTASVHHRHARPHQDADLEALRARTATRRRARCARRCARSRRSHELCMPLPHRADLYGLPTRSPHDRPTTDPRLFLPAGLALAGSALQLAAFRHAPPTRPPPPRRRGLAAAPARWPRLAALTVTRSDSFHGVTGAAEDRSLASKATPGRR